MEGLHTELPTEHLGAEGLRRCNNLWWTIYIIERHFSSTLGLPTGVHDCEVTTPLTSPRDSSQRDAILSLHVKVARLVSTVVSSK
jgi:proline utilization trans-activator